MLVLLPVGMVSCDDEAGRDVAMVKVDGKTYHLELALDNPVRFKGLAGRETIEPDGGMLFVFPRALNLEFVMRDCLADIDILFLDASGRVVATHHMPKEPLRGEGEGEVGDENPAYHSRLKRYPSRFASQFVIELAGGELEKLEVKPGDRIQLDIAGLKKRAK